MSSKSNAQSTDADDLVAQGRNEPTLALSAFGNFFVGGSDDAAHHHIRQMCVQYLIPAALRHPFPIVRVHGGGQAGTGFISTLDSRPRWAHYFARLGSGGCVVDQVARGRSSFVPGVYGATSGQPLDYVMQKFTVQERYKVWPQAGRHTQRSGKGEPGDPTFDQYASSEAQGTEDRVLQSQMSVDALAALLDRQAGVGGTFVKLADLGIHGNGPMMMLEKNSDQVAYCRCG